MQLINSPHRTNILNIGWGIFITLCSAYLSVIIPLELIFKFTISPLLVFISVFISIIFLTDIFISVSKGKKTGANLFEEHYTFTGYFKFILIVDVISVIPFELLFENSPIQLLRLLKLLKVAVFFGLIRQNTVHFTNFLRFLFFAYWLMISVHWISCIWIYLRDNMPADSFENYISALYWTITTLTTVGYGDIIPNTNSQKLFAILIMVMGVGIYGYIIGNIASILSKRDPSKTQYLTNLEKLSALIHFRNIPIDLQNRIKNFYKYLWREKLGYDESTFIAGLPPGLGNELSLSLKKDSVGKIPLFKKGGEDFIKDIALHLKPIVFTPGEFVFRSGDVGDNMYFVIKGELNAISNDGNKVLAGFTGGDYFGEIALFKNVPRTANVISLTYCDLYALKKDSFDYVLTKYPSFEDEIKRIVREREEKDLFRY
jgi:voltage-gated potassium channel